MGTSNRTKTLIQFTKLLPQLIRDNTKKNTTLKIDKNLLSAPYLEAESKRQQCSLDTNLDNLLYSVDIGPLISMTTQTASGYSVSDPTFYRTPHGVSLFETFAFLLGDELNDEFKTLILNLLEDLFCCLSEDNVDPNEYDIFFNCVYDDPDIVIISYPGVIVFAYFIAFMRLNKEDLTVSQRSNILKLLKDEKQLSQIMGASVYELAWTLVEPALSKMNVGQKFSSLQDKVNTNNTFVQTSHKKGSIGTGVSIAAIGYLNADKTITEKSKQTLMDMSNLNAIG
jgi:hypothetical protein